MNCPREEVLVDLVSGDLIESDTAPVMAHVRQCDSCKEHVRCLLLIARELHAEVDRSPCLSMETINAYHRNQLPASERANVQNHLEECEHCQAELDVLTAPAGAEIVMPSASVVTEAVGLDLARRVLRELLPDHQELLSAVWGKLVEHVLGRLEHGLPLQALVTGQAFTGALGLNPSSDSSVLDTVVAGSTALVIARSVVDGITDAKAIEALARQTAVQLGAGPNLSRRLAESMRRAVAEA